MGFFLRKSVGVGPLRLNFSKSGIGISGGVKGARLGVNSQGRPYVHAGRHGIYYRQFLDSKGKRGRAAQSAAPATAAPSASQQLFQQLGPQVVDSFEPNDHTTPYLSLARELPKGVETLDKPPIPSPAGKLFLLGVVAFLFRWEPFYVFLGLIAFYLIAKYAYQLWERHKLKQAKKYLLEDPHTQPGQDTWNQYAASLPLEDQKALALDFAGRLLEADLDKARSPFQAADYRWLPLESQHLRLVKDMVLSNRVETLLADHQLTQEEETLLMEVATVWDLSPEIRQRLRQMIRELGEMRQMHTKGSAPIHASRALKKGENCYFEDDGKFLRRATLSSYTSEGIRYRRIGYTLDVAGIFRITNLSLEIDHGAGIRAYRIADVEDIILALEEGVVEVKIKDRVNPVYFTCTQLIKAAAILHLMAPHVEENAAP
ncbi:MAG: DUF4236 domain-containing protein [Nitritalea sp.]